MRKELTMLSDSTVPADMPADEFRRAGHALIDWIADYLTHLDQIPVLPDVQPGEIRDRLPKSAPATGEPIDEILRDIDRIVMPGMTHWNHPNFMAYFAISSSGPAILGELLSAAFNVNGMLWKTCPACTELEQTVMDWLRQMIGLPESFWGMITDSASSSTLQAIAAAREMVKEHPIRQKGLFGAPRLRLYTSEQAHSSVEKAAIALGLGIESVQKIAVDRDYRLDCRLLAQSIASDRETGWLPFCTVATVGTTSTTSIDPIPEIADICAREKLWLHVDAAYGGSPAILPEFRHVLNGCDRADSLLFNPHKWLFVPIDCSAFFTRRPDILKQAFSLVPEYLKTDQDQQAENLMDYGVQLGRRFRALKLWFTIRYFGQQGLGERIRYAIDLAQSLAKKIDQHPHFERLAPTPYSTICFRAHPPEIQNEKELDRLNQQLLDTVNTTRQLYLSHTRLHGQLTLRMAIGNLHTTREHVDRAWNLIQECWKSIYKQVT